MSEAKSRVGELYSLAETLEGYRAALIVGKECRSEAAGLAAALDGLARKVSAIAMAIDADD